MLLSHEQCFRSFLQMSTGCQGQRVMLFAQAREFAWILQCNRPARLVHQIAPTQQGAYCPKLRKL